MLDEASTSGLHYLVVDEIFSAIAELTMSPWPVVDARGRLRFPEAETIHLEANAELMRLFLRRHRQPRRGAARELRTGDTFAVRVEPGPLATFVDGRETAPLSPTARRQMLDPATWSWLRPPVHDITAEARVAAKLAYYGALTEPLPENTEQQR